MKKYVVGLCAFEEDIQLVIVYAENELIAMMKAVVNNYEWEMEENKDGDLPYETVDEAIDFFLQGDINISKPLEIK